MIEIVTRLGTLGGLEIKWHIIARVGRAGIWLELYILNLCGKLLRSAIYFHVSPQWGALTLDHITHLLLVPHGAPAKNGHLGHSFLLQPLHRVALRSQQLPHKVELEVYSITMMMIIIDYNNADNDYLLWPQKLNWKYLQCWICIDEKIRFVARAIPDRQSIFVF